MKKRTATTALAVAGLATAGCFGGLDLDQDQGPQTTRTVSLTGFSGITANGAIDLTVVVGSEETIKIEGAEDRVEGLKATVEDGTLVLKEESNGLFGNDGRLRVTVTLPALTALGINGSGDAYVTGVKTEFLTVSINGSAGVDVSGEVITVHVTVNGSGDVNARSLKAKKSKVSIAGSGDVEVAASDHLSVSVAGSGDVTYYGDPKVTSAVSGSGDVSKG